MEVRGQLCGKWFSPSFDWIPGNELRLTGLHSVLTVAPPHHTSCPHQPEFPEIRLRYNKLHTLMHSFRHILWNHHHKLEHYTYLFPPNLSSFVLPSSYPGRIIVEGPICLEVLEASEHIRLLSLLSPGFYVAVPSSAYGWERWSDIMLTYRQISPAPATRKVPAGKSSPTSHV